MDKRIELTEYQTPNSKTYLKKDGTIQIEIYDEIINNNQIMLLSDEPTLTPGESNNTAGMGAITGNNNPFYITDTYISSNGTNTGEEDKIKIGVERINGTDVIHRALLKFDLPTIPSSYTIVDATLNLIGYYDENYNESDSNTLISIHQLTQDWSENSTTWSSMNNKYNTNIENYFHSTRSSGTISGDILTINSKVSKVDVTDLVQRWYNNEPNYGLMLKAVDEIYNANVKIGEYYTKNAETETGNPQPGLVINYKNLNGLESYLTYTSQSHELGSSHINNYNGNLTSTFDVANTIGGPLPVGLYLVYNTADKVLGSNYGYGLGIKPNLIQTIKEVTIDDIEVLEYTDEDGTIHYFYKSTDNIYYDEDGLSLKVELIDNNYIMTDKDKNTNKYVNHSGTYYLEEIKDTSDKTIQIIYDTNNRINKVIDASNDEINITYEANKISFISPYKTTIVNITNNLVTSIEDLEDITTITYNSNNLIEKIINSNGLYTKYEYINNKTYRVSKVIEYGKDNSEGNYLEFTYNLKSTSIKDRKGHVNTYVFNNNANTEVITNIDSNNDLTNAYGKTSVYGEVGTSSVNKVTLDGSLVKHVNNLIDNSSFEDRTNPFTSSNSNITSSVLNEGHYGLKSLKISNTALNSYISLSKQVDKEKYYTFSTYIKNDIPLEISLSYDSVEEKTIINDINNKYSRYDVTINYPESATSNLVVKITPLGIGNIWIDAIQLEEGEVANYYNMISNSNFNNGTTGYEISSYKRTGRQWNYESEETTPRAEVVTIDNIKALKLNNNPLIQTTIAKHFNVNGKAGDVFELSFWYKNEGPKIIPPVDSIEEPANIAGYIYFDYVDGEWEGYGEDDYLTEYNKDWHYFSKKYVAKYDFNSISLNINDLFSCRDCYITNISIFKDLESYSYVYDDEGNLVSSTDLSRETSTFNYDGNNQLIEAISPLGKKFKYEYDENVTDRLIRAISPTGITNSIDYDSNNNPIKTIINNTQAFDEIIDTTYYIRAKGTDCYLYIKPDKNLMVRQCECSHDKFNVIKQPDSKIKLQYTVLKNYYLKDNGGVLKIEYGDNNNIFELIEHSDKTYSIKSNELSVTVNEDNTLSLTTYNENNESQHFLFERMENSLFIESSAEYTNDGRFIKSVKDSLGNVTTYDINSTNEVTNSITDPLDNTTNYTYDSKFRVSNISKGEHNVSYEYSNNNLSKITHGTKNYTFEYDNFNNNKKVNINNTNLVENFYENNNGNLTKIKYGNNHEVNYTYDEFDRIKTITKTNDVYKNYYDNLGRIVKLTSNNDNYNYEYDFANRISKYKFNNYKSSYNYDSENNVTDKKEELGNYSYLYNYSYNQESSLTNLNILNNNFNYIYDNLGRLIESNINNNYKTTYSYITNGKKTSAVLNNVNDNGINYSYKYDKLGNITEVKKDNSVVNKYFYDEHSQLIKEHNLVNNQTIEYLYDNYGNILSKKVYTYNTTTLLSENTYSYENSNWQDLLTKFNNETITYDNIGNPLSIGNKTLTWMNGRELSSYQESSNNISYKYNLNGIRTSKVVNNIETKYYLEGNKIVFEDRNNTMLYYLYNGDELLGFVYNGNTYYYHKNVFGDIIGIINSNYEEIVTYEYDSWGAISNITDNSGINLGTINPFRYRSYYYDEETKLYYLNSRYYNPEWGRFINGDSILLANKDVVSGNLFQYVSNNYIMCVDPNGHNAGALDWLDWGKVRDVVATGIGAAKAYGSSLATAASSALSAAAPYLAAVAITGAVVYAASKTKKANKKKKSSNSQCHYVYTLKEPVTKKTMYVGRTTNLELRESQHLASKRSSLVMDKGLQTCLTYEEARGLEQRLIIEYSTLNKSNPLNNQINGIGIKNKRYDEYMLASWNIYYEEYYVGGWPIETSKNE
ncbi:MAG: DNRLRE domain-containing protein [Candidatus Coprovivens sp.]